MKRINLPLSLVAILLVTVGCQSTAIVPGQYDDAAVYPNVTLSQDSLQKALGFQEPALSRTENDLMRVTVPVRARSNEMLNIEYRVIWLDRDGAPVRPEMIWTPLRLEPRQPQYVSAAASSPAATNYNIQFRWGRP
ncbi:MAG: DUF1425 domain-containing protein [Phycisphaeraceae bacterium]